MKRIVVHRGSVAMRRLFVVALLFSAGCTGLFHTSRESGPQIVYSVDVSNYQDDLFHVTVNTQNLSGENNIYNFAATAPGTYSILDFGRLVHSFRAFDGSGLELPVERLSTNKWKIGEPLRLAKITYDVEDSFDAKLSENSIAPMCGSGIDSGFIAFNTFSILGYFEGLQSKPVKLKVQYKPGWIIGTAMDVDNQGYYVADTYDRLADSPVLVGDLTVARTKVNDIDVEVYMFATDTALTAPRLLSLADNVLRSAGAFIGYSPVPYYKFLFCLLNDEVYKKNGLRSAGALEHSYSSLYVLPASVRDLPQLKSTIAHEFMHILTPLNLHSEIIHSYNFAIPTPSEHIWLYEGVTEWVSDVMQLRSGLMKTDEFLGEFSQKLRTNDLFNQKYSLSQMALEVYDREVGGQFRNFYNRGAAVAALLDIRLLELSNGARGLREVFLELLERYGKERPFPETKFFDVLVEITYPQVRQFIDDYIKGSRPLPVAEYMEKLGFRYIPKKISSNTRPTFGLGITLDQQGAIVAAGVSDDAKAFGIKDGDIVLKVFGEELTLENAQAMMTKANSMNIGDPYEMVVKRGDQVIEIKCKLLQRYVYHAFEPMESLSDKQSLLREKWSKHLALRSDR